MTHIQYPDATAIGPLMIDIEGVELSEEDRQLIANPLVGGLILFSRNYTNPDQLKQLIASVRELKPQLLIAVDHEGGRVQRFRSDFTRIPAMARLGKYYDLLNQTEQGDCNEALKLSADIGWLLASELIDYDIDFSFAPVLDIDYGVSEVIGDRAFHTDPKIATALCQAFIEGMREAGMASTGKHFPGHGFVAADSHLEIPVDPRALADIIETDATVFGSLIRGGLDAIMPAHIIYEQIDPNAAGFSNFWLQTILREQMQFEGVIFSDDLGMAGAAAAGDYQQRAQAALDAGCDMVLVCNDRDGANKVLAYLKEQALSKPQAFSERLTRMKANQVTKDVDHDRRTLVRNQIDQLLAKTNDNLIIKANNQAT